MSIQKKSLFLHLKYKTKAKVRHFLESTKYFLNTTLRIVYRLSKVTTNDLRYEGRKRTTKTNW